MQHRKNNKGDEILRHLYNFEVLYKDSSVQSGQQIIEVDHTLAVHHVKVLHH